jgi:hypothetical protein
MATELQEAPTIEVTETTVEDGLDDIPDMVSHLYYIGGEPVAICGLHESNDPHVQMHRHHGDVWEGEAAKGISACPVCGAPLCRTCYERNV